MKKSPFNDFFPNVEMIRCVKAPTLIIHGAEDQEVSAEHGKMLRDNGKNVLDMWLAPGCGHNDIDLKQMKEFYKKIAWFFKQIENGQKGKSIEDLFSENKAEEWPKDFEHVYKKYKDEMEEIAKKTLGEKKKLTLGNSQKSSSSKNNSSSEDPIFRKNNNSIRSGSFKSKSHSFVEFSSSRANSNAMSNPKMIVKEKYIKESSKEIEEEDKNSDITP